MKGAHVDAPYFLFDAIHASTRIQENDDDLLRPLFHFAVFVRLAPPCYGQIVRLQHCVLPVTRCKQHAHRNTLPLTQGQPKVIRNNPLNFEMKV